MGLTKTITLRMRPIKNGVLNNNTLRLFSMNPSNSRH